MSVPLLGWPRAVPLALVAILLAPLLTLGAVFPQSGLTCSQFGEETASCCLPVPVSPSPLPHLTWGCFSAGRMLRAHVHLPGRSACRRAGGRSGLCRAQVGGGTGKAEDPAEQAGGHRARLGDRSPEPGSPLPARCSHVRCSCCLWRDRASYGRCLRVTFPETAASGRGFDWASLGRVPKLLW